MSNEPSHIYTKTGDDGTTGRLFGGRVGKDDLLIEACGDIDEAVAALGMARAELDRTGDQAELSRITLVTQRQLFVIAADLMANPHERNRLQPGVSLADAAMVELIEQTIDRLVQAHPLKAVFIVPGGSRSSAALDLARGIVRRAERHVIAAARSGHDVSDPVIVALNRMSDLIYVLARSAAGAHETPSHE